MNNFIISTMLLQGIYCGLVSLMEKPNTLRYIQAGISSLLITMYIHILVFF